MNINDAYVYCKLHHTKSVTLTAKHLGYTTANIYHVIKKIEHELCYETILINKKSLLFTEKGELVFEKMREIIEKYQEMMDLKKENVIFVGIDAFSSTNNMNEVLTKLNEKESNDVEIITLNGVENNIKMLKSGKLDLFLDFFNDEYDFSFERISTEKMIVCMKRENFNDKVEFSLEDLQGKFVYLYPMNNYYMTKLINDLDNLCIKHQYLDTNSKSVLSLFSNDKNIVHIIPESCKKIVIRKFQFFELTNYDIPYGCYYRCMTNKIKKIIKILKTK